MYTKQMTKRVRFLLPLIAVALVATGSAAAANLGDYVKVNGFGGWAGGDTDGNSYLAGAEDRDYDTADFNLAVTATPSDRLTVTGQIHLEYEEDGTETEIAYAFAEWVFSDAARLRGGLVKQPFGLFTEIYHVGTARSTYFLPWSIYGPAEIVSESYRGLGLTGTVPASDSWDVSYDIYAGELSAPNLESHNPVVAARFSDDGSIPQTDTFKDLVGGRVSFAHASGFSVGLSAYSGEPESEIDDGHGGPFDPGASSSRITYALSLQHLTGPWELRAEWVEREDARDFPGGSASYLEAARYFGENWQLAVRWEDGELDYSEPEFPSFTEHEAIVASLNYWFSSNFVMRLALHEVEGNLFAHREPEGGGHGHGDLLEVAAASNADTRLLQFGLQFSF